MRSGDHQFKQDVNAYIASVAGVSEKVQYVNNILSEVGDSHISIAIQVSAFVLKGKELIEDPFLEQLRKNFKGIEGVAVMPSGDGTISITVDGTDAVKKFKNEINKLSLNVGFSDAESAKMDKVLNAGLEDTPTPRKGKM